MNVQKTGPVFVRKALFYRLFTEKRLVILQNLSILTLAEKHKEENKDDKIKKEG